MIGKSKYIKTVFYSCVNIFFGFSVFYLYQNIETGKEMAGQISEMTEVKEMVEEGCFDYFDEDDDETDRE